MSLTSSQNEALNTNSGALLIIAGPGTGKTRTMIAKILKLLERGLEPDRILAMTFTKKAAGEMQERLAQTQQAGAEHVRVGTMHSACLEILETHGFRLGLPRSLEFISDSDSFLQLREIVSKMDLTPLSPYPVVDEVSSRALRYISRCKDFGIWPEELIQSAELLPETSEVEIARKKELMLLGEIYQAHQSRCFDRGRIDFGDCLLSVVELLQNFPLVREEIHKQTRALLVDEFQDTNWIQCELIRWMSGPETHVVAVGDDDQSIYSFRGASASAFKFFEAAFPKLKVVALQESFRLPPSFAKVSTHLIQKNSTRFRSDKKIVSQMKENSPILVVEAKSQKQEAEYVLQEIQKLLARGEAPRSIAVLTRSLSYIEEFLELAREAKLPIECPSQDFVLKSDIVRDLLAYLELIQNPRDNIAFVRFLSSPLLEFTNAEIFEFLREAKVNRYESLFFAASKSKELKISSALQEKVLRWAGFLENCSAQVARKSPSTFVMDFLAESHAVAKLLEKSAEDLHLAVQFQNQLLDWEKGRKKNSFLDIFPILNRMIQMRGVFEDDRPEDVSDRNAIRVLTVHGSKGLEFDSVFVMQLVSRRFPKNFDREEFSLPQRLQREPEQNKILHEDEERRLLYVAMTRAKKKLVLSGSTKRGTRLSRFLEKDLLEDTTLNADLKKIELSPPSELSEISNRKSMPRIFEVDLTSQVPTTFSFSRLNKYAQCPLQYWFTYGLGLRTPSNPVLELGNLAHAALEEFFGRETGKTEEEFSKIYDRKASAALKESAVLDSKNIENLKSDLLAYLKTYQTNFPTPLALEKKFELKFDGFIIDGRIDRVDVLEDGVKIIDYKTGRPKSAEKDDHVKQMDGDLQLSIYSLAASEVFGWKVRGLEHHYIRDGSVFPTERSADDLRGARQTIQTLVSGIQSQNFDPTPESACRNCEFARICPSAKI